MENLILITGFLLASYSVVGNDVIQTLGTFISSNKNSPWVILWFYTGSILTAVLFLGWWTSNGDVSFGRLALIPLPDNVYWWFILPPITLLIVTRLGLPVSTTFMILSAFTTTPIISKMITKSVLGYAVGFSSAVLVYVIIAKHIEKKFLKTPNRRPLGWIIAQWISTGFLWSQWLIQDFANIYVFLPRQLSLWELILSLITLLGLLGYIFYQRGGKIQKVVNSKINTQDIRSATIIDFLYGITLLLFTIVNPVPMSTTLTFIGVLGGRELGIKFMMERKVTKKTSRIIFADLGKVFLGFLISLFLVMAIRYFWGT